MAQYLEWLREKRDYRELKAMADRLRDDIVRGAVRGDAELVRRMSALDSFRRDRFPDKAELFDMVYMGRFRRLWEQFGAGRE